MALTASKVTVLIDDVRRFRDDRPCQIARSSGAGVALLKSMRGTRIDELWLDHDLGGDDTIWPVIRLLETAEAAVDLGVIHIHASRSGPAHEMAVSLRRLGYETRRCVNPRLFIWS